MPLHSAGVVADLRQLLPQVPGGEPAPRTRVGASGPLPGHGIDLGQAPLPQGGRERGESNHLRPAGAVKASLTSHPASVFGFGGAAWHALGV
jgi:hypothetical protein